MQPARAETIYYGNVQELQKMTHFMAIAKVTVQRDNREEDKSKYLNKLYSQKFCDILSNETIQLTVT